MQDRVGIKDIISLTLLVIVLISIWLGMSQYDRQWNKIQQLNDTVNNQTQDLAELRKALAGVEDKLNALTQSQTPPVNQNQPDAADDEVASSDQPPATNAPENSQPDASPPDDAQARAADPPGNTTAAAAPADDAQADAVNNNDDDSLDAIDQRPGRVVQVSPENQDPFARRRAARQFADFATGGWFLESFGSKLNTITPLVSSDAYARVVQNYVLESLCERNPETLEWTGLLAQSWKVIDNSDAYLQWEKPVRESLQARAQDDPSLYQQNLAMLTEAAAQRGQNVAPGSIPYERLRALAAKQWVDAELAKATARPPAAFVIFQLRDNITFSDGTPITPEDVVFTFNFTMNPRVAAPRARSYLSVIDKVIATGPREVTFVFKEPYFEAFDLAASFDILPRHYYEEFDFEVFNQSKGLLVGSGPFRLQDPEGWEPSNTVSLVRNNRYWGTPAALDRVVFRLFTQAQARLAAFRNGEVDMLPCSPEQYDQLLADEDFASRMNHYEYQTPYNGYRYIAWNQAQPDGSPSIFADKRVRQALTMLIDRPRIVNEIQRGYASVSTGPFNPLGEQNSPNVDPWPYDVQRAVALLKEAGWEEKPSGHNNIYRAIPIAIIGVLILGLTLAPRSRWSPTRWILALVLLASVTGAAWAFTPAVERRTLLYNQQGQPFRFTLTYPSGSPAYESMVLLIRDGLAEAGIVVELDPLEFSVLIDRLDNRSFQAISLGWTSGPETDINQMFHSDQIDGNGDNFMAYRSQQLDRLIERARRTIGKDQRMEIWRQCHEVIHDDQPYTFISWGKSLRFVNPRLKNLQVYDAGLNPATEWYIPESMQTH